MQMEERTAGGLLTLYCAQSMAMHCRHLPKVWVGRVCVGHEATNGLCMDSVEEEPHMQWWIVEFEGSGAVEGRGGGDEYTLTGKGEDESTNTCRSLQEESGQWFDGGKRMN